MNTISKYPGFDYASNHLKRFLNAGELFTIQLINNEIIHHETKEYISFRQWLLKHNVVDIKAGMAEMGL